MKKGHRASLTNKKTHEISAEPSSNAVEVKNEVADPEPKVSALSLEDPVSYTWFGITVKCKATKSDLFKSKLNKAPVEKKTILDNVFGEAKPGELLVIIGSSGAGKTTLINCLTFRTDKSLEISGHMITNGMPVSSQNLIAISGYVQQVDLFIGSLTVKECLIFHAMVRMDKHIPFEKRIEKTEEVMRELNLKKCENTLIGIPGKIKGISGGELKRLSFATELLTDPQILFCDEPTSGLDSFMAQNVVSAMKELAKKGKTVISTIHQPSSEVFGMVDKVLFLADGKVAFLGNQANAENFFKSFGLECPNRYNPADFYVSVLSVIPGKEEDCRRKINMICKGFNKNKVVQTIKNNVEKSVKAFGEKPHKYNIPTYRSNWLRQFIALFWRAWLVLLKDPTVLKAKLIQTILVGTIIGVVYFQQRVDQNGVMNINGALFVFIAIMTFQNMFAVINTFSTELPIFMREHTNGMYRTDVYYLSKILAELPMFLFFSTVFTCIVYLMIGLNWQLSRFLGALTIAVLIGNISSALGYFMSCACANITVALALATPVIMPFLLFGGFLLNIGTLPKYISWFQYVSWFKYGNEALMINQWKGVRNISCTKVDTICPKDGAVILKSMNFQENNFYFDIGMLLVVLIIFQIGAFCILLLRAIYKRL